jgi:hypothetical protein
MTATVPDQDLSTVEGIDLEANVPCEEDHEDCTVDAVWSCPPSPCGCYPRMSVCQGDYDYIFNPSWSELECVTCGFVFTAHELRQGWWRL